MGVEAAVSVVDEEDGVVVDELLETDTEELLTCDGANEVGWGPFNSKQYLY